MRFSRKSFVRRLHSSSSNQAQGFYMGLCWQSQQFLDLHLHQPVVFICKLNFRVKSFLIGFQLSFLNMGRFSFCRLPTHKSKLDALSQIKGPLLKVPKHGL